MRKSRIIIEKSQKLKIKSQKKEKKIDDSSIIWGKNLLGYEKFKVTLPSLRLWPFNTQNNRRKVFHYGLCYRWYTSRIGKLYNYMNLAIIGRNIILNKYLRSKSRRWPFLTMIAMGNSILYFKSSFSERKIQRAN